MFRVAYEVVVKILPSGPVVRHCAFTGKDLVSIPVRVLRPQKLHGMDI